MAASKNPIHRRLDRVSDQWVEFAERRGARLLCWRACDDERPMLDAFLAVESDADAGSQPDLFVRLTAPFREPERFAAALTTELAGAARALEQGLGEDAGVRPWSSPSPERGESALALFLRAAADFARHHALTGHLALWLSPSEVSDVARLEDWLGQTGKATEHYLSAEAAATAGEHAGDEACRKLRVQVRLARGSLLLSAGAYAAAAELFISTIPLASAASEPRLVIDAYRLASFCYEGDGKHAEAWRVGIAGLRAAAEMDGETLQTSTLSYLGEGLLRLAAQRELPAASRDDVEKQPSELLGPDAG